MKDSDGQTHDLNRDYENRIATTEAERIAITAAKLAVNDAMNELFSQLGVARGSVESMEKFRRDLMFMRDLRDASDKAKSRFYMTLVALFAGAFAYGIIAWLKDALSKPH
jgi:hypothetical protein